MITSMAIPIRFWSAVLACLLLYQFATEASADWCKYEKEIDLTLELSGSELLAVSAAAGDLDITGIAGSDKAVIRGKICTSKEAWLNESQVELIEGSRAQINVNLPAMDSGWSLFGNRYAWIDLKVEVPNNLPLEVRDSSGDIRIKKVAGVRLQDSSGDIEIEDTTGDLIIRDSSGDIEVSNVTGDFTVEVDSSGDIYCTEVNGSVLVKRDSSGDIRMRQITENAVVEADSSGDISATDIGGDFRVLRDSSGSIRSRNVSGEVQLPEDS